jgi:exo-beta-1,3-glucanase (GH17 family)
MKYSPIAFLAALVLSGLTGFLIWQYLGSPVSMVDAPPGRVHCLSYTPFTGDDAPSDPDYAADPRQIERDLKLLAPVTECIRIYSPDRGLDVALPMAQKLDMKVLLGIWIARDEAANEKQIAHAIRLAHEHPDAIKGIIVGNEVLLRGEQGPKNLIRYIRRVADATHLPVTYADVTDFWMKAPKELAEAVDFITIHILPYWENDPTSAAGGVAYLKHVREEAAAAFPGKRIFIGETGFPSAGRAREAASPSLVDQALYLREFMAYAESIDLDYNLIEAFDQPWKRVSEGTVGGYWGVYSTDRVVKFPWRGPVSEHPDWQRKMLMTGVLSAILLIFAFAQNKSMRLAPAAALGVIAAIGATLLILQGEHSQRAARTWLDDIVECVLFLQTFLTLTFILPQLARGSSATTPKSLQHGITWLRRPKLSQLEPSLMLGLLQLLAILGAMVVSLGLAFDNRYRDFPLAAFAIPALSFATLALMRGDWKQSDGARHEEVLFFALTLICGGVIIYNEGALNSEAATWIVFMLLLILPWWGVWRDALSQLRASRKSESTRPNEPKSAL